MTKRAIEVEPFVSAMKRGANTSTQCCQQVSVLLYNIIIYIYYTYLCVLIHILQYMCMCFDASLVTYVLFVCLCVRVLLPVGI